LEFLDMTLTATADTDAPIVPPPEPAVLARGERPVFAATTPVRPRALRLAGRVTAGLVALWLVALVLGTFGFGPVAGIGLPRIGGGGSGQPHREAAHKTQSQQPGERVTRSGVTLSTRYGGATAAPGTHPSGASHRSTAQGTPGRGSGGRTGNSGSHGGSTGGGSGGSLGGSTGGGNSAQTQAATPSASTPTASTPATTTTTHGNSTHSNATPPGSSSAAPGSRSNASTAPGRDQSASSPSPGSGRSEHAPPKG
jgi:hypothetical protein